MNRGINLVFQVLEMAMTRGAKICASMMTISLLHIVIFCRISMRFKPSSTRRGVKEARNSLSNTLLIKVEVKRILMQAAMEFNHGLALLTTTELGVRKGQCFLTTQNRERYRGRLHLKCTQTNSTQCVRSSQTNKIFKLTINMILMKFRTI